MCTIGERLRAHWLAQSIITPPGVAEDRLTEFETRFCVALPADMRDYFLHVDGMWEPFQWDDDLFNFRPLSEVESISNLEIVLEDQSSYFVFADHSIWLPAYAIRLTPSRTGSHHVIAVASVQRGGYAASVVAHSFSEFVERYLTDETSRDDLSLGMPITTEEEPDQSEGRAATLKWVVENIDQILSIFTSFGSLPGGDILSAQLGTLREIKKKAVEELRSPKPNS
jgi:hypothetical protein